MIRSSLWEMTRAVWGVSCTSFSMPALALATVKSSKSAPSCMINATSPAAKSSWMKIEAMSARETRTSALISKRVVSPITASRMIGIPQKRMESQATSKGRGRKGKRLFMRLNKRETPPITRNTISFFIPPTSNSSSNLNIIFFMLASPFFALLS